MWEPTTSLTRASRQSHEPRAGPGHGTPGYFGTPKMEISHSPSTAHPAQPASPSSEYIPAGRVAVFRTGRAESGLNGVLLAQHPGVKPRSEWGGFLANISPGPGQSSVCVRRRSGRRRAKQQERRTGNWEQADKQTREANSLSPPPLLHPF